MCGKIVSFHVVPVKNIQKPSKTCGHPGHPTAALRPILGQVEIVLDVLVGRLSTNAVDNPWPDKVPSVFPEVFCRAGRAGRVWVVLRKF